LLTLFSQPSAATISTIAPRDAYATTRAMHRFCHARRPGNVTGSQHCFVQPGMSSIVPA
jgi:hypothetical protein